MAQQQANQYRKDSLKAQTIAPHEAVVGTIADVRDTTVPDNERESGYRDATIIEFYEFPSHIFWCKAQGRGILRLQLGANVAKWINKKIPLTVQRRLNPRENEEVDVLDVAPLRDWEGVLRDAAAAAAKPKPRVK